MKSKENKGILFVVVAVVIAVVIKFFLNVLGGFLTFFGSPHHPPIGRDHGARLGHHHFMHGPQFGGGFHLMDLFVFLIVGLAVAFLLFRWMKKRKKDRSYQHNMMETPIYEPIIPVNNSNKDFLDEWEKKQMSKKEDQ